MPDEDEGKRMVLFTVNFAVQYVRSNRDLSEEKLRAYYNLAPEYFRYMRHASLKDVTDLLEKHLKGTFYSRDIEILLSPDGRSWLERNFPVIKKIAAEMNEE